jgi:GNAT superfamily N-acetyltransferase
MGFEVALPHGFTVSDDRMRLDLDMVYRFISEESYWGKGRTRDIFERAVRNSLCFGVYSPDGAQGGFARVLTDKATRAHLNDVFVLATHRGMGLGTALISAVLSHPELCSVTTWTLSTNDAHALYARFGFGPVERPEAQMMRRTPHETAKTV